MTTEVIQPSIFDEPFERSALTAALPSREPNRAPDGAPLAGVQSGARKGSLAEELRRAIKGSVTIRQATTDELAKLQADSQARGVAEWDSPTRRVKRTAAESALLDTLCDYADSFQVDVFGAVTFSDEYASKNRIYTLRAACDDVHRGLRSMPMNRGRAVGYRGRFALAAEWHKTGRDVPHVHFLLQAYPMPCKAVCEEVWAYFAGTRGRTRCEPIVNQGRGVRYALKDVLKQCVEHPEALDLCTTTVRRWK